MSLQKSPAIVRNQNVYICKPEPTCVSWRQHLPAVLTSAFERHRRIHLQASAGLCWNLHACADGRKHLHSCAGNREHLQAGADMRLHLQTERLARPEGAPCR